MTEAQPRPINTKKHTMESQQQDASTFEHFYAQNLSENDEEQFPEFDDAAR